MSALSSYTHFVTVADYLRGEERSGVKHEYLNGTVHAMAGGTLGHDAIGLNVTSALKTRLRGKRCRPHGSDAAIHLSHHGDERIYYPDASVTCSPMNPAAHTIEAPVLVVEVLSDSTARTDRTEKKEAYLRCPSLQHFLLIEPDRVEVTLFTREAEDWKMTIFNELTDEVPLPGIETSLPLAEIYES